MHILSEASDASRYYLFAHVEALITSPMASEFAVRPNPLRCPEGSGYIWERSVLLCDAVTDHSNHQYAV